MINNMKISIIIPFYNEAESIRELFEKIQIETLKLSEYDFDFLFVDDGSTDNSINIVKEIMDSHTNNITIVSLPLNRGKTQALKMAFAKANGDYIITMDADLQDNPIYIKDFINEITSKKLDLVVGYRKNRYKNNIIKLLSSNLANFIVRVFFKYSIHDMNCGYKIFSKKIIKNIYLESDYHRFIPIIATATNFNVGEMIIEQKDRMYGKSKYGKTGIGRSFKFFFDLLSLIFALKFERKPLYFFGKIGFFLSFSGFLILLYLTVLWFAGRSIQSRPLFFMGILNLIVGINFFGFGLLGELINKKSNKNNKSEMNEIIK